MAAKRRRHPCPECGTGVKASHVYCGRCSKRTILGIVEFIDLDAALRAKEDTGAIAARLGVCTRTVERYRAKYVAGIKLFDIPLDAEREPGPIRWRTPEGYPSLDIAEFAQARRAS